MDELTLRYYPDPILRTPAKSVEVFDNAFRELAEAMVMMMGRERGIGLAAPQVGISRRLIVALQMPNTDDTDVPPLVLVNPKVVSTSSDTWTHEEGCLSIPGVNAPVIRSAAVDVEYQDLDGNPQQIAAEGMFARILLHEIDHLDGRLFIDYLSSAQKSLIKSQLKSLTEDNRPS